MTSTSKRLISFGGTFCTGRVAKHDGHHAKGFLINQMRITLVKIRGYLSNLPMLPVADRKPGQLKWLVLTPTVTKWS